MTSTPKWEEIYEDGVRAFAKGKLTPSYLQKLLNQVRDEAYVEGYKAGSGDLGTRTGAEYVGFQEKIDEAVRETRKEILATFDEMVTLRPKEAERSDIVTFRNWLRRRAIRRFA